VAGCRESSYVTGPLSAANRAPAAVASSPVEMLNAGRWPRGGELRLTIHGWTMLRIVSRWLSGLLLRLRRCFDLLPVSRTSVAR
jgi:hypothetical protein